MKKISLILIFLFFFCVTSSQAEDVAVEVILGHITQAMNSYLVVNDYVCLFEKEELDEGKLADKEKIYLKFEKPFKIFMHWKNRPKKGLEVMYERGQHDDKLVIHQPGLLLGLMPVVFLEQDSPWVRKGSESYDIEDAGIGTFLTDFEQEVSQAAKQEKLKVISRGLEQSEGMEGEAFDIYFLETTPESDVMAYHVRVLFDSTTKLPLYQELYDWNDKLTGRYSYKDLRLNVSEEPSFKQNIHPAIYKIYTHQKD